MDFQTFLARVIEDGIKEVNEVYDPNVRHERIKRDGALSGFEACRGKTVPELTQLLAAARTSNRQLFSERPSGEDLWAENGWWYQRYHELQIEWVCNVVSCALVNMGFATIVPPTSRAMVKARIILGDHTWDHLN